MLDHPTHGKPWHSWLYLALWSGFLLVTIPFARAAQALVEAHWGRMAFTDFVLASIFLATGGTALYLYRHRKGTSWGQYVWLAGVGGIFVWYTFGLRNTPVIAMHLVNYGVLAVLAFRALSRRVPDPAVYLVAVLIGMIVGTTDQIVKWFTPRRYFDYADLRANTVVVLLVQVAIARGFRPAFVRRPIRPASVRWVCAATAAALFLLGLCLTNTPTVVDWYASRIPSLAYLKTKDSVMSEYGYRHCDPEIGVFFSRFTLEELVRQDRERGEEAARILYRYRGKDTYEEFLRTYTPGADPFLHEARVHLFRRDRYLWLAMHKVAADESRRHYHNAVAFRENRILEKYFGETLRRSTFMLSPNRVEELRNDMDTNLSYVSEVSSQVITRFHPREAWCFIVAAWAVLALVARHFGKKAVHDREAAASATR